MTDKQLLALAEAKAAQAIKRCPSLAYLEDDLQSAALYGAAKALAKDPNCKPGYIGTAMYRAIVDYVSKSEQASVPRSSRKRAEKQNKPIAPVEVNDEAAFDDLESPPVGFDVDDLEELEICCGDDEFDQQILYDRIAGYKQTEIAKRHGCKVTEIKRRLDQIDATYRGRQ
jgi:DNA-directed RNA polymerase specialized sigma24 family protein